MKMFVVDAFTDALFKGNPAAVCPVAEFPDATLMQAIASENRFSETAFTVRETDATYRLRWFTPGGEVDLCGHATLATAHVIFTEIAPANINELVFTTQSGPLTVTRSGTGYAMTFPSYISEQIPVTNAMTAAFGATPTAAYLSRDLLAVFDGPETVRNLTPDLTQVAQLPGLLQNVTAPDRDYDCVSRTFGPKLTVDEDPVCGSAHCQIAPYWSQKLNKPTIAAFQASERTGVLQCTINDQTTTLAGNAVTYSVCELPALK